MKGLKEQIIKAVQDATDLTDGKVSILILDHFLDGIISNDEGNLEKLTERNTNVVSKFMNHCKNEGHNLPDHLFESFFGA